MCQCSPTLHSDVFNNIFSVVLSMHCFSCASLSLINDGKGHTEIVLVLCDIRFISGTFGKVTRGTLAGNQTLIYNKTKGKRKFTKVT